MDKPTKPNVDLPNSFGGVKNNFSTSKILNGYEKDVPDIFGGANINYMLDTLGKRQTYYDTIVDYINGLPIGKTITTDSNNKLVYEDLRTDFSGLATVDLNNLTTTGENHFANKSLSNLNATGENHFINKRQVTNCILEAPSTVIWTVSGSTLTIKAGVKVLIPNGRNADASLNNIEYTVENDISYTYGVSPNPSGPIINDYIFLKGDGTIERLNGNFVFIVANGYQLNQQTGNNQYRFAYVEENNLWYKYDYTVTPNPWTEVTERMTLIGKLNVESNNAISNARPDLPLSAWSNSTTSKSILSTTASFPSDWLWVDLSGLWTGASPTNYVAPADGYVTLWRQALAETDWICLAQALSNGTGGVTCVSSTGGYVQDVTFNYLHAFLPVQKGSTFTLTHRGAGALLSFKFIYAKGEE